MSYLDEYLDKIAGLPIEINRELRLIKELDYRAKQV